MSSTKQKSEAPEPEAGEGEKDQTLHLRMDPEFAAELDRIVEWLQKNRQIGRLRVKLGREKALRYAVGHFIDNPPEQGSARA